MNGISRLIASAIICISLSSCSTSKATLQSLNLAYRGKNADSFFLKHGPPESRYPLKSGGSLYTWSSEVNSVGLPSTTRYTANVSSIGTVYGTAVTSGGGFINVYTILRIMADQKDVIEGIEIQRDTIGNWTLSRFVELFHSYND